MTSAAWIDRARSLVPVLEQRVAVGEARGYLPPDTVFDLAEGGFLSIWRPARLNGAELPLGTVIEIVMTLAEGCASTAWCLGLLVLHNLLCGMFPEEAQHELWSDARQPLVAAAFSPGATATRQPRGEFLVRGRWGHASAIDHADWVAVAAQLQGRTALADVRLFLIPRGEFRILDTWSSTGLRATGSKSVEVEGHVVPAHRSLALVDVARGRAPGARVNPSPLYRLPLVPPVATVAAAPACGIARRAVDEYGRRHLEGSRMVGALARQLEVAMVEADTAGLLLRRVALELSHHQDTGAPMSRDARARYQRDGAVVVATCLRAVERLAERSGREALVDATPLERATRDLRALATHSLLRLDPSGRVPSDVSGRLRCPDSDTA